MIGVVILLTGMGIGAMLTVAVQSTWHAIVARDHAYPQLPAATARQIARVRRRNRADLTDVRPARDAGVRVRALEERHLVRLGEPPSFDPFGEEHTR